MRDFSREAHKRMPMATKLSILWIVFLQSCQFTLDEVNILCEYTTMHGNLRKKRATIHHSEMLLEILTNSTETTPPPPTKTPDIQVVDVYNINNNPRVTSLNH